MACYSCTGKQVNGVNESRVLSVIIIIRDAISLQNVKQEKHLH